MERAEYARHFTTLTDGKLIALIDKPQELDPVALDAAHEELERRRLTATDMRAIRAELEAEAAHRARTAQITAHMTTTATAGLRELRDTLLPPTDSPRTDARQVMLLVIVLSVVFLWHTPRFMDLRWLFAGNADPDMVFYFAPLVILPYTIYQVAWRRLRGWLLATAFTTYICARAVLTAWYAMRAHARAPGPFDALFPLPSGVEALMGVVLCIGLLALFLVQRTRTLFHVTAAWRWIAIATGLVWLCMEVMASH